tara:strand:+ start:5014 stop:5283 length:270 start_codon:yes stop_codon:yes gene_type:complete
MSDTHFVYSFFLLIVVVVGVWVSRRGRNTRTVITGPSKEEREVQREVFSAMTIAELKVYIASKGRTGRLPTLKAQIVEVALGLWSVEPW